MHTFVEKIEQRITKLNRIILEKEDALKNAPKGLINVCKANGRTQYYYKENSKDTAKKYLRDNEKDKVVALCQKDYDERVLLAVQKELKQLEKLKKNYPKQPYEDIYEKLIVERKALVQPIIMPDEEFIKNWEQVEYEKKGFHDDAPEYYTDKGERVRSKTEILIANALKKYDIPYRYEAPLKLKGYGTIHPDFTVLNVRTRKEMYWEHMGLMDDADYLENALHRIAMYEKNDIFPGDKLILTHETSKQPINSKMLEKTIFKYLK